VIYVWEGVEAHARAAGIMLPWLQSLRADGADIILPRALCLNAHGGLISYQICASDTLRPAVCLVLSFPFVSSQLSVGRMFGCVSRIRPWASCERRAHGVTAALHGCEQLLRATPCLFARRDIAGPLPYCHMMRDPDHGCGPRPALRPCDPGRHWFPQPGPDQINDQTPAAPGVRSLDPLPPPGGEGVVGPPPPGGREGVVGFPPGGGRGVTKKGPARLYYTLFFTHSLS